MNFISDNTAAAAAEILAALTAVNDKPAAAYGEDPRSRRLDEAFGAQFYDRGGAGSGEVGRVVSWNQSEADVDAMGRALAALR